MTTIEQALQQLRTLDMELGEQRQVLEGQIRTHRLKVEALRAEMEFCDRATEGDDYVRLATEVNYLYQLIDLNFNKISDLNDLYRKREAALLFRESAAEPKLRLTRLPFETTEIQLSTPSLSRVNINWTGGDEEAFQLTSAIFNRFTEEGGLSPQVAALLTTAWATCSTGNYIGSGIEHSGS